MLNQSNRVNITSPRLSTRQANRIFSNERLNMSMITQPNDVQVLNRNKRRRFKLSALVNVNKAFDGTLQLNSQVSSHL